ncbi:hypothetical protein [Alicyclobacillus fodiniaquatilis]|uniref:Uncharacterized protein n=1 Tax=Alicyclobacillus fodiniaquatilis TaxID=1661150 RepID=A0ABW4JIP1_9BACL
MAGWTACIIAVCNVLVAFSTVAMKLLELKESSRHQREDSETTDSKGQ